jgi:hypothetical protein
MYVRRILLVVSAAALAASTLVSLSPAQGATPAPPAPVVCAPTCWTPPLVTSWQWKLNSPPTTAEIAANTLKMWDIDGFDNSAATVSSLHAHSKVVCYISAGSYEGWRSDASSFPGSQSLNKNTPNHATLGILGWKMSGWDERWLDIRGVQTPGSALAAIMTARVAMCQSKGFDAVEFDNVDGYTNNTGFPLTAADQLFYNALLANTAHSHGLAAFLKNDNAQIPDLLPYFDAALNEQCWQYKECTVAQNGSYGYDQFVAAGKAVFGVEYSGQTTAFCPKANSANFNWLKKKLSLNSYRVACR